MSLRGQAQRVLGDLSFYGAAEDFVIGLNNHELKRHFQFGHPKNLNEATDLALEYESCESGDSKKWSIPGKCHIVEVADDQGKAGNQVLKDICSMV